MPKAAYKGSATTFALVKEQIAERFGDVAADSYDPNLNCFTLRQWNERGYRIKKGEKAIKSFTIVAETDDEQKEVKKWRKPVFLFFHTQVEKVGSTPVANNN